MEIHRQFKAGQPKHAPPHHAQPQVPVENRQSPRFKIEVRICVYLRDRPVLRGRTVDISESGIAAMLMEEVPLGEVVRLEFTLPLGEVELHALVRQRRAFRYGFQFVEQASAHDMIGRTCRQLAVDQALSAAKPL